MMFASGRVCAQRRVQQLRHVASTGKLRSMAAVVAGSSSSQGGNDRAWGASAAAVGAVAASLTGAAVMSTTASSAQCDTVADKGRTEKLVGHSTTRSATSRPPPSSTSSLPVKTVDGVDSFRTIVVGGGTAGCVVAYLTAKWMQEKGIPGTVLLVDRGADFTPARGPSPHMSSWYDNWGHFGEIHDTSYHNGEVYPVPASDHRGIGGCGSHDTRITFQPTEAQKQRLAGMMGWDVERLQGYYQAALNMIPVSRAIHEENPEKFYREVIEAMTGTGSCSTSKDNGGGDGRNGGCCGGTNRIENAAVPGTSPSGVPLLHRLPEDTFHTMVVPDSVAECSLAMYGHKGDDEVRWTSAYLLSDGVRPSNLKVVSDCIVDRVQLERPRAEKGADPVANGVVVIDSSNNNTPARLQLDRSGGVGGDVILTSGTFGCAGILQRSGVGPAPTLASLGIDVVYDNPEVGHGVDHQEVALQYAWNTEKLGEKLPKGGANGWPLVVFASLKDGPGGSSPSGEKDFTQCHFGAGFCEPYTDEPSVVITPSCVLPDPAAGYRCYITSKTATPATSSMNVLHCDQQKDMAFLARSMRRVGDLMGLLQQRGLVSTRLLPPLPEEGPSAAGTVRDILHESNDAALQEYIKQNHWTVYHWCSSCRAGVAGVGSVADEHFRVRCRPASGAIAAGSVKAITNDANSSTSTSTSTTTSAGVIPNLYVGSAAALPEIPECNPHTTITAFSFALVEGLINKYQAQVAGAAAPSEVACPQQPSFNRPALLHLSHYDVRKHKHDSKEQEQAPTASNAAIDGRVGAVRCRKPGEEVPALQSTAVEYFNQWKKARAEEDREQ